MGMSKSLYMHTSQPTTPSTAPTTMTSQPPLSITTIHQRYPQLFQQYTVLLDLGKEWHQAFGDGFHAMARLMANPISIQRQVSRCMNQYAFFCSFYKLSMLNILQCNSSQLPRGWHYHLYSSRLSFEEFYEEGRHQKQQRQVVCGVTSPGACIDGCCS